MRGLRGWSAWSVCLLVAATIALEFPLSVSRSGSVAYASRRADLRVIRMAGSVVLVLDGMGPKPDVRIERDGQNWEAQILTPEPATLPGGVRQFALPEIGMASVVLEGSGRSFVLSIEPLPGRSIPNPVIASDGLAVRMSFKAPPLPEMAAGSYDLTSPGVVRKPTFVPPLRKRATAPPVGDMAVGSMFLRNPSFVPLKGPPVTLTTRNAPPRDVLMLLAKMGGYNFAYSGAGSSGGDGDDGGTPVTVSFNQEPLDKAFNFVLLSSGLQAKLEDRTVLVGANVLMKTTGNQVSRVYRLNQVSPDGAADYLANLGATITKTNTITTTSNESSSTGVSTANASASTSQTSQQTVIESFGASQGPLLGLIGTTDKRLGTITLIGNSYLVTIAENYLKQLDLRKRQVAVNVKILNVNLENATDINNNFSAQIGDTFIVGADGKALINFGRLKPASATGTGTGVLGEDGNALTGVYPFALPQDQQFVDIPRSRTPYSPPRATDVYTTSNYPGSPVAARPPRPGFGPYANPQQMGAAEVETDDETGTSTVTWESPKNFKYPQQQLFDFLTAAVESSSAKTISDPTLLVQEGEEAEVLAVESVITDVAVTDNANNTTTSTTTRDDAGITLKVVAEKIDDNGFITLNLNPIVSVPVPAGFADVGGTQVVINDIVTRELKSGKIRLRDGQTLFLTGVISDRQVSQVTKWPVLGDIPFFGQFFRKSNTKREKSELIIVVTPRIIDDDQGGAYGYGYQPATQDARKLIYQP